LVPCCFIEPSHQAIIALDWDEWDTFALGRYGTKVQLSLSSATTNIDLISEAGDDGAVAAATGHAMTTTSGPELGFAWTIVLDRIDGTMSVTLVNREDAFVIFGACTRK
jgi:hypothetical protein